MRAGFGIIDITPPLGVELAGYGYYLGRRCDSVRDRLFARAVLLESESGRQLIVSFDVLGISREITDALLQAAAALGIPRERVLAVSIHTHTGPAIKYHLGCGEVDEDYVSALSRKCLPLVQAAEADLAEVTGLSFTRAPVPGDYIYNRAAPDGPVDRDARGFLLDIRGKAPILLAGAACHGVFLRRVSSVSADFSGELHKLCAEAGIRSVYLNGLCGDIDPLKPSPQRMEEYAGLLFKTLRSGSRPLPLTLSGGRIPFTLRVSSLTRDQVHTATEKAVEKAGGPEEPAARCALTWEKEMLERLAALPPSASLPDTETGDAAFCVLGGVPILALPFEGYTGIGLDFRRLAGCPDAMVLGCAEQLLGYLPTRDDFLRDSYAARESFFLYRRQPVVPGEAERLAEQLAEEYLALS